ncbi:MAG: EAL domain-containing protein [Halopseudomonas sp.]|uniref:putative bifunctional diguanylate cyclase/phosphodiesterase n=1 Tax=Halopseudomonas sp. TaxID=2901191 RepID=UPI003002A6E2
MTILRPSNPPISAVELRLQQMNQLYAYSRLPQWLMLGAACLIVALLWGHTSVGGLMAWAAVVCLLALLRQRLVARYHACQAHDRLRARWRFFFHLGNLASGLCLAWVYIGLTPLGNFTLQVPVYSLAGGVSLCVGVIYASRFPAFASFIIPAWLPPVAFLLLQADEFSQAWALMGLILFVCIVLCAIFIHRSVLEAQINHLRNEALVANLSSTQQRSEELNQQLAREVAQRRSAEQSLRDSHEELEARVRDRTAELERASHELQASQTQLSLAMDASQLGLWDWDLVGDKVYHSQIDTIFGIIANEGLSMLLELKPRLHPADAAMVRKTLVRHMKGETEAYRMEYRVRHENGQWVWVEDAGQVVERDANGRATRMIGTRRDITARKYQNEQAVLAATVFEATSEGIFILDPQFNVLAVNQAYSVITGLASEAAVGRNILDLSGDTEIRDHFAHLQQLLGNQDRWQGELTARRRTGEPFPIWLQLAVVRDSSGQVTHYVGFFADLTTHRQTEEQLQYLTNYDALTQLANRSLFNERLQDATSRARQHEHQVALLHIDLDRFKQINASLGHAVADNLLQEVARRLRAAVQPQNLLARLSADEFVVIIEQPENEKTLAVLAHSVLEKLREPMLIGEQELVMTASIGISLFPATARDSLLLITQANQAMQHAKQLGGNNAQFFTHELRAYSLDRLQLENQLRKALEDDQLLVYYQPKLHLASDRIRSAEALVRWQHPERGLIMPGEFINIAEESGLIGALGDCVLRQACQQASQWYQKGPEAVAVSVNLSVQQLRQEGFARDVAQILRASRLPARLLELELTESMLLEHSPTVSSNIDALKELGVILSVDDFGTGYSSLAYLKRFPISTLKIDRAFVAELDEEHCDDAIIRAIIAMAHSLSLNVVAEGVEHESQLNFLKANGCDEVQGYLISRPIPADEFTALLAGSSDMPILRNRR